MPISIKKLYCERVKNANLLTHAKLVLDKPK
jgi:hypothetical protein